MSEYQFNTWVIDTGNDGFIGRYWWFNDVPNVPEQFEGCHIAMFRTRQAARKHIAKVKESFPDAQIVKVTVRLEV